MDAQRFDAISKRMAAGTSRRQVLRALATSVAMVVGLQRRRQNGTIQAAPWEFADVRFCHQYCAGAVGSEEVLPCVAGCALCEATGGTFCGHPAGAFGPPFCCATGSVCQGGRLCCPFDQVCTSGSIVECCAPGYRCVEVEEGLRNCVPDQDDDLHHVHRSPPISQDRSPRASPAARH